MSLADIGDLTRRNLPAINTISCSVQIKTNIVLFPILTTTCFKISKDYPMELKGFGGQYLRHDINEINVLSRVCAITHALTQLQCPGLCL